VIKLMVAVTPGQVIPIVIGAAGMGASVTVAATAGGNTLVGTSGALLVLSGGSPGVSGLNAGGLIGGPSGGAGFPAGGDATDTTSNMAAGYGGHGASGPFGTGGSSARSATSTGFPGKSAYGFGAGGSGAGGYYISGVGSGQPGGQGAPGLMIIEW
jgi:hypothetical protein